MDQSKQPVKVALIGHGYWGKNIARVFNLSSDFELHTVCDQSQKSLDNVKKLYPSTTRITDFKQMPKEIDLVAIVTPTDTHYELAKYFLDQGKNVLLTKPFTKTLQQAEELIQIADEKGLTVFVDHTFVFNPAVRKMKEMLPKIGQPYFILSQRLNLGLYQPDVNVIYDLVPHDISIISYLFDQAITSAQTSAFHSAGLPQEDLAHSSFVMESGLKGLVTVSWLSPYKIRQFVVVGSEGMLSYDDTEVSEKVKFFDRGISLQSLSNPESAAAYTTRISYRSGDLYSPAISNTEALSFEVSELKRALTDKDVRQEYNRLNLNVMRGMNAILAGLKA